ncbi:MAG: indole-3-glycerol phosphate synthase TrpC [Longimicrobiales bacterium]
MNILEKIIETKSLEVKNLKRHLKNLLLESEKVSPPRDFLNSLMSDDLVGVIAEIKRRSPGAGAIRPKLNPVSLATNYESSGAVALSILTDTKYFGGSLKDLRKVRDFVGLPILRKDFIIDESQIYESLVSGADAILLIVSVLDDEQLRDYREMAESLGMAALIEAHDLSEVERGLSAGASLLGINNRNLKTFDTNLKTTIDLIREIPPEVVLVSESGVHSKEDVSMLGEAGVDAVLVGESLLRKDDPGKGVRNLSGQDKRGRSVG